VADDKQPLSTSEIVRLIGVANDNREQQTARLMRMVPTESAGADQAGLISKLERYEARDALLKEFQWQCGQRHSGKIAAIDPLLVHTVKDWGFRIFMRPRPIQALEYFLGLRRRPGKRAKPDAAEREFEIALAVVRKMGLATDPKSKRMTLEKAAAVVATEHDRPDAADYFVNIYKRHRKAAKAAAFLERDPVVLGPDPLADILPD